MKQKMRPLLVLAKNKYYEIGRWLDFVENFFKDLFSSKKAKKYTVFGSPKLGENCLVFCFSRASSLGSILSTFCRRTSTVFFFVYNMFALQIHSTWLTFFRTKALIFSSVLSLKDIRLSNVLKVTWRIYMPMKYCFFLQTVNIMFS